MQRQNSKLISDVIDDLVREYNLEDGLMMVRVSDAWDLLMTQTFIPGTSLAEAAKLTSSRHFRNGVFSCRVASSVLRTQLRLNLPSLKDQINRMLQGDIVKEIILN